MRLALTEAQQRRYGAARQFAATHLAPHAGAWDAAQAVPLAVIGQLAAEGYLGANVAPEFGGFGYDSLSYGLLHEAIGAGCSSVRSLLTVHGMVCHAVGRWGSAALRQEVLPALARGELLGAFALSEPDAGSDVGAIALSATATDAGFVLDGTKQWITFGQLADRFIVFARGEQGPGAFLVDRDSPGLSIEPITGMLGTRASMLARLRFTQCRVPATRLLGKLGFGQSHVLASTLDWGRFSVAWGSVGIGQACLDSVLDYVPRRVQSGAPLAQHQLVQRHLTGMVARLHAARLLCHQAALARERKDPQHMTDTQLAKYQAALCATELAHSAVQLLGANGCTPAYPVERLWRDARIMEIIEGTNEVLELHIARAVLEGYGCDIPLAPGDAQ